MSIALLCATDIRSDNSFAVDLSRLPELIAALNSAANKSACFLATCHWVSNVFDSLLFMSKIISGSCVGDVTGKRHNVK